MKPKDIFPLLFVLIGVILFGGGLIFDESRLIVRLWPYQVIALFILLIVAFIYQFEREEFSTKQLTLIAMISGISAVLRIPFSNFQGIQPCTTLIICSGFVFGPIAGFFVGALTPFVSNFFLGHGPWTPLQMIGWGLPGLTAGYLGRTQINFKVVILFAIVWGFLYGWIMNIWHFAFFVKPHTFETFIRTYILSIGWDVTHAFGNALFMGIIGERTIRILTRYKERFTIERV